MRILHSLKARLLVLTLVASLPVVVNVVVAAFQERAAALSKAESEVLSVARQIVADHAQMNAAARQVLQVLSGMSDVTGLDPVICPRVLLALTPTGEPFGNFGVIGRDGEIKCSGSPRTASVYVGDRPYFQRAVRGKGYTPGEFQIGRTTGIASVNFALPVYTPEGDLRAVLYTQLPLHTLINKESLLPEGSTISLIDPLFNVIYRHPADEWAGKTVKGTDLHRVLTSGRNEGVSEAIGFDHSNRVVAFSTIRASDQHVLGYVIVSEPEAVVLAPANSALMRGLLLLVVVVALMAGLTVVGSNVFVLRRVNALVAATRKMAAGELDARVAVPKDENELTVLGTAFNDMATRIEVDVDRISRLNRIYAVLTEINGAIFRIRDPQALVDEACRIAAHHGNYLAVCIYLVDKNTTQARLASHSGAGKDYFENVRADITEPVLARNGPIVRSLKTGKHVVEQNLQRSTESDWKDKAFDFGCRAIAAFPLILEGRVLGTFALISTEPNTFDGEETDLLLQLAADTALGLEFIDKERQLYDLSNFDSVTALPNRRLFEDRVTQALGRARRTQHVAAVLLVRVERFRQIVDTFGWAGWDDTLRQMTRYFTEVVRQGDTVARLGDDEFGVLLTDARSVEELVATADRLMAKFPRSIIWSGHEVITEGSMGIAIYPNDGADQQTLIHNAKITLDNITIRRGNAFAFYSSELNQKAHERQQMEVQLSRAVEHGELSLVYQPVVRIQDRSVVGAEALLRWKNPLLGQVSPASFVPIAEQSGLITEIGQWVFDSGSAQRMAWAEHAGAGFRMSVNVAAPQLRHPDFLSRVKQVLERTGLDPHRHPFGVEITESQLVDNIDRVVPVLETLRSLGVYLSIDDFGTGYSSLSYLRRLPVNAVKIDISFVREIVKEPNAQALASSIIALGHSLKLQIVAEGVETEDQLQILDGMGCDMAQGYLFSRPVPAADFARLLSTPPWKTA